MGYDITPQRVEEMRRFLLEHPLDRTMTKTS